MSKQMFVYIMTNKGNTVLYTGVTSNLKRRVYEHKEKIKGKFTARYNVNKLETQLKTPFKNNSPQRTPRAQRELCKKTIKT